MSQQPPVVSRRTFTKLGATAAAAFGLSEPMRAAQAPDRAAQAPDGEVLKSELLMLLRFEIGNPSGVGGTTAGVPGNPRGTTALVSGVFEGPKVSGVVIPPSAEYASGGGPDVHQTLVTDDNQRIYMHYQGFVVTPPGQEPMFSATSAVGQKARFGPLTTYYVINPWFEAGTGKYAWMNNIVAVGIGYVPPYRFINYRIYQIL